MDTKITKELPPKWIYDACVKQFGANFLKGDVFAGDNEIHCAYPELLPDDVVAHEELHMKQHVQYGFKYWWEQYLEDPEFRLAQEIEAYQAQYQYMVEHYNSKHRKFLLKRIAHDLSGKLYGNLITFEEAKDAITS